MKNKQGLGAILLAAGKGTRMRSEVPKVLHRCCGQTLLERSLRAIVQCGVSSVSVVVGAGKELVEKELSSLSDSGGLKDLKIVVAHQEEQLGTGHAAQIGLHKLPQDSSNVVVMPADIPLLDGEILSWFIEQSDTSASVNVLSCRHPEPAAFGRLIRDEKGKLRSIVEKKDCMPEQLLINEINTSIYLVQAPFLRKSLQKLSSDNAQGELLLTDIVALAVGEDLPVEGVITESVYKVSGANNRLELSSLEKLRRSQINQRLMLQGVSFEDPSNTYVDEEVEIGRDSYIGANTKLSGKVYIGTGVVIEGNCQIADCSIADYTVIKSGCYLAESAIGKQCQIGPMAQLRPGTVLGEGVKVGNFVEIKNAQLAKGVKANHLAYIGDAEIGENSNIGAGTIFCNYDGKNKNRCVLGADVFVGSNSVLVAPVSISDGAYIAAGSAITKDVPEKALGVARSRQSNVEGWVERKNRKEKK